MPFRFKPTDETVETGFRRIACWQIDEALALIRAAELPPERIVHQVRRACKALRGLLRLVRPVFPAFATENAVFRDIAWSLSGSRDRKVLRDTFDGVTARQARGLDEHAVAALRVRLLGSMAERTDPSPLLEHCAEQLLAARVRAASWSLTAQGWDALGPGLQRTYRAARRAMQRLAQTGNPHMSHEWRKQAKYHWQHMRLLRAVAPGAAGERVRLSARLGDLLGDRHDLDLLVERLHALPPAGDAATIDLLVARAGKRAARLEDKAARIGDMLFEEKPGAFAGDWGAHWRAWARETRKADA